MTDLLIPFKSFTRYPALRFEIDHGLTLCRVCHQVETAKERQDAK